MTSPDFDARAMKIVATWCKRTLTDEEGTRLIAAALCAAFGEGRDAAAEVAAAWEPGGSMSAETAEMIECIPAVKVEEFARLSAREAIAAAIRALPAASAEACGTKPNEHAMTYDGWRTPPIEEYETPVVRTCNHSGPPCPACRKEPR